MRTLLRSRATIVGVAILVTLLYACGASPSPSPAPSPTPTSPATPIPTFDGVGTIMIAEDDGGGIDLWTWAKNVPQFLNTISFSTQGGAYGFFDGGDALAAGNFFGYGRESVIVAEDDTGGIDVWQWDAKAGKFQDAKLSFFTLFDSGDALAVGDVIGDGRDEFFVAEDNGGSLQMWAWTNFGFKPLGVPVTTLFDSGDTLAVGDVWGDSRDEILIAEDSGGGIDIWAWNGITLELAGVSFSSQGGVYGNYDGGDALRVGDVWDNPNVAWDSGKDEVVIAEDDGGGVDVWYWNQGANKFELTGTSFPSDQGHYGYYDSGDALAVGNVLGDAREEIVIAEDDGGGIDVWTWDASANAFLLSEASFSSVSDYYGFYDSGDSLIIAKPEPPVCMRGDITDGDGHPLVDMHQEFEDLTNSHSVEAYSDGAGKYGFCTFAGIQARLTSWLESSGVEVPVMRVVAPGTAVVTLTSTNFTLLGDVVQPIDYGSPPTGWTPSVALPNLPAYATMYYRVYQGLDFAAKELGLKLNCDLPEDVYGFGWPMNTAYHCCADVCPDPPAGVTADYIVIGSNISATSDTNTPDNREWHEFAHHIMCDSAIAGDDAQPLRPAGDVNHGAFANQSTSDSWIEGWAPFISLVMADMVEHDPQPHLYRWAGAWPALGGGNYGPPNSDLERNWQVREDEEFAMAGILWDLYDGGPTDDDSVDLTIHQIFATVAKPNITDLHQVHLAFQTFFTDTMLSQGDLDAIFIRHGASGEPWADTTAPRDGTFSNDFFCDEDSDRVWDDNVNIGYTPDAGELSVDVNGNCVMDAVDNWTDLNGSFFYDPPRPRRESKPDFRGSNLCVTIVDENGSPVTNSELVVSLEDGTTYTLPVQESPSQVYFSVPPDPVTLFVVAHKEGLRDSLPILVPSELYWWKTRYTGQDCILTHTFVLNDPREDEFDAITPADLREAAVSREAIDAAALLEAYTVVAVKGEDRHAKLLVRAVENALDTMDLLILRWAVYARDGSELAAGGPLRLASGQGWDMAAGGRVEGAADLLWDSQQPGTGYLVPGPEVLLGLQE